MRNHIKNNFEGLLNIFNTISNLDVVKSININDINARIKDYVNLLDSEYLENEDDNDYIDFLDSYSDKVDLLKNKINSLDVELEIVEPKIDLENNLNRMIELVSYRLTEEDITYSHEDFIKFHLNELVIVFKSDDLKLKYEFIDYVLSYLSNYNFNEFFDKLTKSEYKYYVEMLDMEKINLKNKLEEKQEIKKGKKKI